MLVAMVDDGSRRWADLTLSRALREVAGPILNEAVLLNECHTFNYPRKAAAMASETKMIPLTRGLHAIVDAEDYELVSNYTPVRAYSGS